MEGWDSTAPPCHEPGSMHITLGNTKGELTLLESCSRRWQGKLAGWEDGQQWSHSQRSIWVGSNGMTYVGRCRGWQSGRNLLRSMGCNRPENPYMIWDTIHEFKLPAHPCSTSPSLSHPHLPVPRCLLLKTCVQPATATVLHTSTPSPSKAASFYPNRPQHNLPYLWGYNLGGRHWWKHTAAGAKMGNFHFPFARDIWRGHFCQQLQDRSSDLRTNILGSKRLWHIIGNYGTLGREILWAYEKEGFFSVSQSLQVILASSHTIYHFGQQFTTCTVCSFSCSF